MDTLFNLPPSLSPRLLWMQKHGIETEHQPQNPSKPWVASMRKDGWGGINYPLSVQAETEDDALTALAVAANIRLWNEQ